MDVVGLLLVCVCAFVISYFSIKGGGGALFFLIAPTLYPLIAVTFFEHRKWLFTLAPVGVMMVAAIFYRPEHHHPLNRTILEIAAVCIGIAVVETLVFTHIKGVIRQQNP